MTDKKERIINTALILFANDGYNAVSTSKIAKEAGVSEGLIFKHFSNKKGLLDAIVKGAECRTGEFFAPILEEMEPLEVIKQLIILPFMAIHEDSYSYWKLQFKLKWQEEYNKPNNFKPLLDKLTWAFNELGYKEPAMEAEILMKVLDGIAISILREGLEGQLKFKAFLLEKYIK